MSRTNKIKKYTNETKTQQIKLINNIKNLISNNQLILASEEIENYICEYPSDCYITHQMGKLEVKKNNLVKAKELFLLNINNNEKNKYYSMYELARVYFYEDNYESAQYYFKEIINSNHPNKMYAMFELSKIYERLNKIKDAENILNKILKTKTYRNGIEDEVNKDFAKITLSEIYLNSNQLETAILYFQDVRHKNKIALYDVIRGRIECEKGNTDEARKIFEYIIRNDKRVDISAKFELTKLETYCKNHNKAIILASQLKKEKDWYSSEASKILINNYLEINEIEKAKTEINNLLTFGGKYKDFIYLNMGKICVYEKKYDDAKKCFSKVTEQIRKYYQYAKLEEIFLLIKEDKIEEAKVKFNNVSFNEIASHLRGKYVLIKKYFNIKFNQNDLPDLTNYTEKLLYNYDKNLVIEHIAKHKIENNDKRIHSVFNNKIDINELYCFAQDNIKEENFIISKVFDFYFIEYKNVGYYGDKTYDHIKVITLPNSKDIINIYPCDFHSRNIDSYQEEIKETEIVKVKQLKRESQIDKFNKKFAKFI